jgi:hypothetical protein
VEHDGKRAAAPELERIAREELGRLSVMMPCTIAVYAGADGVTRISTLNAGLMGRMFGGEVSAVMAGPVAKDQAEFVKFEEIRR